MKLALVLVVFSVIFIRSRQVEYVAVQPVAAVQPVYSSGGITGNYGNYGGYGCYAKEFGFLPVGKIVILNGHIQALCRSDGTINYVDCCNKADLNHCCYQGAIQHHHFHHYLPHNYGLNCPVCGGNCVMPEYYANQIF